MTIPEGNGPFPAVIFVHGSGANDRDETMGNIKTFKDLANQLASLGIASIRYDKRTYVYGQKIADTADLNWTVKNETIDDAIFALELALQTDIIDSEKIYIAGHSMGGYLIPRIYEADSKKNIAGYISMAGSARSLEECTLEQIDYLLNFETDMTQEEKEAYKRQFTDAFAKINNLTKSDRGKKILLMGNTYPAYWLDLADYDPAGEIKKVDKPLLFLQGGHDYQVTKTDFNLWKEAVGKNENAKFILYPNLTHAFTYTEKMSKNTDYLIYAAVDTQVGKDIFEWIKNN